MIEAHDQPSSTRRAGPRWQLKVWHLVLLVLFVAVAIAQIQDQRTHNPFLITLASAGFALYGLLGALGWRYARRFDRRIKPVPLLLLYCLAMAALFLVATFVYVYMELAYYSFQ